MNKNAADARKAQGLDEAHSSAKERLKITEKEANQQRVRADEDLRRGRINQTRRDQVIDEQDQRIKTARAEVNRIQGQIDVVNQPLRDAENALRGVDKDVEKLSKEIVDVTNSMVETNTKLVKDRAAQYASWPGLRNGSVAQMAREQVDKQKKEKSETGTALKALQKAIEEQGKGSEKKEV